MDVVFVDVDLIFMMWILYDFVLSNHIMLIFLLLFVGVITECDHHHLYSTARFPWPPNFIFPSYPSQLRVPPGFLRVSSGFGTAVHDASAGRSILAAIYQSTNPS